MTTHSTGTRRQRLQYLPILVFAFACEPTRGRHGGPIAPLRSEPGTTEFNAVAAYVQDGGTGDPTGSITATQTPPIAVQASEGCGGDVDGSGEFETRTVVIDEFERTYHILVPDSYDPDRAYPVVFRWHGKGGDGLRGGLGIEYSSDEDAIVVGADGLDKQWSMANETNDLALFDAMLRVLSSEYCIDEEAIFAYGFSSGAGFTNLLACERGDVVRASAAIAGFERGTDCLGTPAAWMLHDEDDARIPLERGFDALEVRLAANACTNQTVPEGESCVRYQGCIEPVVWCQTSDRGHSIQSDFAPPVVWEFFADFLPQP